MGKKIIKKRGMKAGKSVGMIGMLMGNTTEADVALIDPHRDLSIADRPILAEMMEKYMAGIDPGKILIVKPGEAESVVAFNLQNDAGHETEVEMARKKKWTAEQWDESRDILTMIVGMEDHARKLRLYACAWFRSQDCVEVVANEQFRRAIEAAEQYADGHMGLDDMVRARDAAVSNALGCGFVAADPSPRNAGLATLRHYRRDTKRRTAQLNLLREVFGNPFRPVTFAPSWRTPDVTALAHAAYDERLLPSGELDPVRLTVLADALEEAGASNEIIAHLRSPGPHVRGCWAVDLANGK